MSRIVVFSLCLIVGALGSPSDSRKPLDEQLCSAASAWSGSPEKVRELLRAGANPNTLCNRIVDAPPLHESVTHDYDKVALALLKAGARVNGRDERGGTALQKAASLNRPKVAKVLIAHSANVNAQDKRGESPLHEAATHGYLTITKMLISAGANVNIRDKVQQTPLHTAATANTSTKFVGYLIESGANVNAKDKWGNTPLDNATYRTVRELIRKSGGESGEER